MVFLHFNSLSMESKISTDAAMTKDDPKEGNGKKMQYKSLVVHGAKYRTLLTKKYENRKKWEKANENQVKSFIPGTIGKIFVKKGDNVKRGQRLLILEAMKMMNDITAPADGIIEKIYIKEGDRIPKGIVMLELI